MSSTLYARGTMLQTGVRQRAERTEQAITTLQKQVETIGQELTALKRVVEQLAGAKETSTTVTPVTAPPPESGVA